MREPAIQVESANRRRLCHGVELAAGARVVQDDDAEGPRCWVEFEDGTARLLGPDGDVVEEA